MAIAFNLPSERDASEENYSRLNRLLIELYEVLCQILIARLPVQEHENRQDRSYSESDIERPIPQTQHCRRSASSPPVGAFTLHTNLEDDVFVSPRTDNGNDPFSTGNLEIFGHGSPRTPAGILLSSTDRAFTFSMSSKKQWRDKGGTECANADVTDASSPGESAPPDEESSSDSSASIIPGKVSGSICTAILLLLGWKLFFHKR